MKMTRFCVLCVVLLLAYNAFAQKYNFRNYLVVNGLGSSSVNHIFQDSKGYIWFATQGGGASRFNGRSFKNFTKADGLIANDVTCITEGKDGIIWIATAEGVSAFNGTRFTNYNQANGLTNGVVYGVFAAGDGRVWFALQDEGIRIFNGKGFDSLTVKDRLPSNGAYCITQSGQGPYWFGLANGIAGYANGRVTDYSAIPFIKDKTFFSVLTDSKGNTWFGSTGGDVVLIHPDNTMERIALPEEVAGDFIGGITEDRKGNIWLATDHGLLKYTKGKFKLFGESEGLSVYVAQSVMADYEDNVWIGTLSGGANVLHSEAFAQYDEAQGLSSSNVTAICNSTLENVYYVGTGDGLYSFEPAGRGVFEKVETGKETAHLNISSLSLDKHFRLWVSSQQGVFVFETTGSSHRLVKSYTEINGERIISPLKIIHDSKGNCWVATYGSGLLFINEKGVKQYHTGNGFVSDKALTVYEDSKANIWIGTQDAGVVMLNGNRFQSITLPDKAVWSITEDDKGNLYFGTGEAGLCRYNGTAVTTYTHKQGLLSDYLPSIYWDSAGHCIWLGNEMGLQKLEFDTKYGVSKLHAYANEDGFSAAAINQNGIWRGGGGLWLATVKGLWAFNDSLYFERKTPAKVQLTGVRLFYMDTSWQKLADSVNPQTGLPVQLQLAHFNNHLTFDIQALTTGNASYTYMLQGQDAGWSVPATNNQITYSNILPGNYTFRAKAINATGVVSNDEVQFSFTVKPPWWNTWWFRLLLLLIIITGVAAFVKAREKALRESNRKLEATVTQRTHEISQQKQLVEKTLTEKEGLLQEKEILLKEIHHRVKNNLQTISSMLMLQSAGLKDEQAKKAIAESQTRVRSIALVHQKLYQTDGLEKVELNAFVKDLTAQIQSVFRDRSKQINLQWEIPETYLLIDAAIPLGLILNELLTNSFKYAFNDAIAGEIRIELNVLETSNDTAGKKVRSKKVKLAYMDSGPGLSSLDVLNNASTLGLRLIKLLSQQIGAQLQYSNETGSRFTLLFSINF